jgi:hypothetical protein
MAKKKKSKTKPKAKVKRTTTLKKKAKAKRASYCLRETRFSDGASDAVFNLDVSARVPEPIKPPKR